jgi:hypothetical protein
MAAKRRRRGPAAASLAKAKTIGLKCSPALVSILERELLSHTAPTTKHAWVAMTPS